VEVTLRLVVLRRRKQWSYRQIEQEVRDSPSYRSRVRVYDQRAPDHSTLNQAGQAAEQLSQQKSNLIAEGLVLQFNQLRPLIERVIDQATRRVLQGEAVPAQEKVASLWEPHTQIIRRGRPQPHETEFGHKCLP
jgi:IS5 family transposase